MPVYRVNWNWEHAGLGTHRALQVVLSVKIAKLQVKGKQLNLCREICRIFKIYVPFEALIFLY